MSEYNHQHYLALNIIPCSAPVQYSASLKTTTVLQTKQLSLQKTVWYIFIANLNNRKLVYLVYPKT